MAQVKRYFLEYTLEDSGELATAYFDAEDEFDAEGQLEEFLSTDNYDLVSCYPAE